MPTRPYRHENCCSTHSSQSRIVRYNTTSFHAATHWHVHSLSSFIKTSFSKIPKQQMNHRIESLHNNDKDHSKQEFADCKYFSFSDRQLTQCLAQAYICLSFVVVVQDKFVVTVTKPILDFNDAKQTYFRSLDSLFHQQYTVLRNTALGDPFHIASWQYQTGSSASSWQSHTVVRSS